MLGVLKTAFVTRVRALSMSTRNVDGRMPWASRIQSGISSMICSGAAELPAFARKSMLEFTYIAEYHWLTATQSAEATFQGTASGQIRWPRRASISAVSRPVSFFYGITHRKYA